MQQENTLHTIHFHPYYNSKQFCAPSTTPSYNSKHLCVQPTSPSYNSVHKGKKQEKIGAQQAYNRRTIVCAPYMFNFFHRGALHVQFTYNNGICMLQKSYGDLLFLIGIFYGTSTKQLEFRRFLQYSLPNLESQRKNSQNFHVAT